VDSDTWQSDPFFNLQRERRQIVSFLLNAIAADLKQASISLVKLVDEKELDTTHAYDIASTEATKLFEQRLYSRYVCYRPVERLELLCLLVHRRLVTARISTVNRTLSRVRLTV
jgi:hypothetical protein